MSRSAVRSDRDFRRVLAEAWAVSDRINQLLLEHLDPRAWRTKPPGGKGRTIAAIFAHVHNVRRKWLRLSAPHRKLPAALNRSRCTQKEVRAALAESAKGCEGMLTDAWFSPRPRVHKFRRDGWAPAWPAGAAMFAYMISHEAHHRGQVCMLAHQLGFPLPPRAAYGIWLWEKLWRECGFTRPR